MQSPNNLKKELAISKETHLHLRGDKLLFLRQKEMKFSSQLFEFRDSLYDILSLENCLNSIFFKLIDPSSKKEYELSEFFFDQKTDTSFLLESQRELKFFFPGKAQFDDSSNNNSQNKKKLKGSFTIESTSFSYEGQILALNNFFDFVLEDKIQVSQFPSNAAAADQLGILNEAYVLLEPYWREKKNYFMINGLKKFRDAKDNSFIDF